MADLEHWQLEQLLRQPDQARVRGNAPGTKGESDRLRPPSTRLDTTKGGIVKITGTPYRGLTHIGWFSEPIASAFYHQWSQGPRCKEVIERLFG